MTTAPEETIQRKEVGASPASLVHVGERHVEEFHIEVTSYNEKSLETLRYSSVASLPEFSEDHRVWIQVIGLHKPEEIGALCQRFEVHPLVAEDILNTGGMAKLEDLNSYLFSSVKVPAGEGAEFEVRQVSVLLMKRTVITFVEDESTLFAPIHRRLTVEGSRIRLRGSDYMKWAILDVVSDTSMALIDRLEDRLEELEEQISSGSELPDLNEVHGTRRKVAQVYRMVRPFRDITNQLYQSDSPLLTEDSTVFFRDLHDHGTQAVEFTDFLREHASSLRELYFTTTSHRMNEVMKILASISAIFLPLTFLAGMYGMNFEIMPELRWKWGYPVLLLIFVSLGVFLVRLFRKRGWL
ncbi:magnesium/cobalt transporter CorA [Akkermansiaceae bacterium]|nr:magnesium/cobalt transporter CorA [Akkermansiaceae bacterium]